MSNLLQGTCTTAQQAPGYYNNYLNTLATCGIGAAKSAHFVGATPLQQQAFGTVAGAANSYLPALQNAQGTLGAANAMAAGQSPLASAQPYLQNAAGCLSARTAKLMNPYVRCVVNQINTLGQQNIQQNLAPQATAGAVGSGQFGSQRGAQVLGQTIANANQQILGQEANALVCGYKTALCGALKQGAICQQLGATAANAASQGVQNLGNLAGIGRQMACTAQRLGLQGVCAINKLGANQQSILQAQQCFPLTELTKAGNLLSGKQIPLTTQKTSQMSGLGQAAALTSSIGGFLQTPTGQSIASGIGGLASAAGNALGSWLSGSGSSSSPYSLYDPNSAPSTGLYLPPNTSSDPSASLYDPNSAPPTGLYVPPSSSNGDPYSLSSGSYTPGLSAPGNSGGYFRAGGPVGDATGCAHTAYRGALPVRR